MRRARIQLGKTKQVMILLGGRGITGGSLAIFNAHSFLGRCTTGGKILTPVVPHLMKMLQHF